MHRKHHNIYEMTAVALCTALLCVCSYIVIPLPFSPVVLSLHTVAVNLTGLLLRPKNAALTVLAYMLFGLVGLPVFAGGTTGASKLFGPTGGFYFGFLFAALVISLTKGKSREKGFRRYLPAALAGLPVQHIFAVLFMCFYNEFNIGAALLTVSLPFLPGDVLKCIIAAATANALDRAIPGDELR